MLEKRFSDDDINYLSLSTIVDKLHRSGFLKLKTENFNFQIYSLKNNPKIGVNIRYGLLVRHYCTNEKLRCFLLTEMLARTVKQVIFECYIFLKNK